MIAGLLWLFTLSTRPLTGQADTPLTMTVEGKCRANPESVILLGKDEAGPTPSVVRLSSLYDPGAEELFDLRGLLVTDQLRGRNEELIDT